MRRILMTALLAAAWLSFTPTVHAQSAMDHQAAGLAAYWRLNFHEAQAQFQAAVNADPNDIASLYYLAYTTYKIAEPKRPDDPGKHRAAELFAQVYDKDPLFAPDWGGRVRVARNVTYVVTQR